MVIGSEVGGHKSTAGATSFAALTGVATEVPSLAAVGLSGAGHWFIIKAQTATIVSMVLTVKSPYSAGFIQSSGVVIVAIANAPCHALLTVLSES